MFKIYVYIYVVFLYNIKSNCGVRDNIFPNSSSRIFFYQILYRIEIKNIFFSLAFEAFKHRAKIIEKRKKKNHSFFFDFESIKISTGSTLCQ